ncbi:methyltransferase domain-containing protein [Bacillus lacus]|uniref:Uncharacterized methyltransferase GJU40_04090 n=1 Tax=Metabacillus lacus TaxID=1983721 RepID=A0A7X2IYA3_9BACI|nr:class I SAM-dependent methyltransferase [Metabacillus lacus]MRX71353.1 methyltransferase domain-containing protein [Metabacillus lacus]
MGREFLGLFEQWAGTYDTTVNGHDEEYKDVFLNYDKILTEVVKRSGKTVLEFGVGTGNLTKELLTAGKHVAGVEPSDAMREIAVSKLSGEAVITDGDFLEFQRPQNQIDSIVSTYAFHHLTDNEKEKAVEIYGSLLQSGGNIVFADTVFINQEIFSETVEKARQRGYYNLAQDLESEYYTTHTVMKNIFEKHGFHVEFTQMNGFVWIMEAVKQ